MVNPVKPPNTIQSVYAAQIERQAWREEMLTQFLSKAREVVPAAKKTKAVSLPGPPSKGSRVDVIV